MLPSSAESLQAHTSLIFAFSYQNQTGHCYNFAAQQALGVPAQLRLRLVDTGRETLIVVPTLSSANLPRGSASYP